jgi:hypothetical protein
MTSEGGAAGAVNSEGGTVPLNVATFAPADARRPPC